MGTVEEKNVPQEEAAVLDASVAPVSKKEERRLKRAERLCLRQRRREQRAEKGGLFRRIGWTVRSACSAIWRFFRRAAGVLWRIPGRFRRWLKNTSIKKAFMAVLVLAVSAYFCLFLATGVTLSEWRFSIYKNYPAFWAETDEGNEDTLYGYFTILDMTPEDQALVRNAENLTMFLCLAYVPAVLFISARYFYNLKLKEPLKVLHLAADKMGKNDLDFEIRYESGDELGQLCGSFERMRAQLQNNNRETWRMMEERQRLNAAFAHDLRTPLTVLKGYTEFLANYVPTGKVSEEKLLSTVSTMQSHVNRLQAYVDTMNTVQKLEDIRPEPQAVDGAALFGRVQNMLQVLQAPDGPALLPHWEADTAVLWLDEVLFMRVLENLIGNAIGHAQKKVETRFFQRGKYFYCEVSDDGRGFTPEEIGMAKKAFYKEKGHDNTGHFGLGLHICDLLCQKHGGTLALDNRPEGGARVTASFALDVDKK